MFTLGMRVGKVEFHDVGHFSHFLYAFTTEQRSCIIISLKPLKNSIRSPYELGALSPCILLVNVFNSSFEIGSSNYELGSSKIQEGKCVVMANMLLMFSPGVVYKEHENYLHLHHLLYQKCHRHSH